MATGRQIVMTGLLSIPLWLAAAFLLYWPSDVDPKSIPHPIGWSGSKDEAKDPSTSNFWKHVDLKSQEIPETVSKRTGSIKVKENVLSVDNIQVFYREAQPESESSPHISILLLHGAAFSSQTWLHLGTIQILAAMGYRTVAIDIPGYGKSSVAGISDQGEFLNHVIKALGLKRPVVVSPSMSGTYALPYLLKYSEEMGGYIPVAPVGTSILEKHSCATSQTQEDQVIGVCESLRKFLKPPLPNLSCIKTPTLVVFGEYDRGKNSALLCLLPRSQAAEIPEGRHPAYLDNPKLWHKLLYNFLGHAAQLAAKSQ
ncbi:putative protein-lysine deacylase ABHD14B isoform X1 [Tachypleus tridentatus]|uniref:putative protein-lysine deacylase ABHD14B isoform X1 n=1 Tax=Tachypleus tridentatus TaxID=6853 RepID=UPI003FD50180